MATSIEACYQAAIDEGKINGAVICVINSVGDFVYEKAIGQRLLLSGEKRPQRVDDVLFLASATKLTATIAALRCVDEGLLTLDGDLSTIAPELAAKQVLIGWAEDGETPLYEPAARPITLRMLLTHSAGLNYHFLDPKIMEWRRKVKPEQAPTGLAVEEMFIDPLSYQPGTSWMYGSGLDWAGLVVERITGLTLLQFMQKYMFDPLNINDAQFYPVTREDLQARMVNLNPEDPSGLGLAVVGGDASMNRRSRGDFGGHGLFVSGTSFVKLLHSLLINDGKLLKPETADIMFQHQLGQEATDNLQKAFAGPIGPNFRVGVDLNTKMGYGLSGTLTLEDVDGWYGENTLTWGGGLTLTWFIDRKNGLCGVGAPQFTLPLDMEKTSELKQVFRRDIYGKYAEWKQRQ